MIQKCNTSKPCGDSSSDEKPKEATLPEHFPNTFDTSSCVSSVSDKNCMKASLPADLPTSVINGIRNWQHLPEKIRNAIETLFEAIETKRAAESEERKRR